jgi:hypothetical protein
MRNFHLSVIIIIVTAAILQQFLPWWIIAVVAFATGYLVQQKSSSAFIAGFISIFLLWVAYAWILSYANNDILAKKVAMLLPLKGHVSFLLIVTGIVGGLVSGFAALSGRLAANVMR